MDEELLETCFRPLVGLPCWDVHRWHGSMIWMNFGEPSLRIREPIPHARMKQLRGRGVHVHGEWQLDIGLCAWRIADWREKTEVAHCESSHEEIDRAARFLDGQKLVAAPEWSAERIALTFRFDLGGRLRTWGWKDEPDIDPASDQFIDPSSDQWTLYEPGGYYLHCDQMDRLTRTHKSES